jgi:LmbE family N-acetylglucosaminyl deacetylase
MRCRIDAVVTTLRILAVHAHPDDIETLCAGTLALLAARGHAITIATMTAGDCGSAETDNAQTARIRMAEADNAARIVGANYVCAGFGDLCLFNDDASRRRTTELVRAASPDLVITAAPADYHPDHEATSRLVRDACFAAPIVNYRTGNAPPLAAIPHLYFTDPIGGRDRDNHDVAPDFAVDIGAFIAQKRAMLGAHESQKSWVEKHHGIADFVDAMESWSRRQGRRFGVAHAEGFRQYGVHPYPATPRLQELAGEALLATTA